MQYGLVETVEALNGSPDSQSRWACAERILEACGAGWITAGTARTGDLSTAAMRSSVDPGLMDAYFGEGIYANDPFLPLCATGTPTVQMDVEGCLVGGSDIVGHSLAQLFESYGVVRAALFPVYRGERTGGLILYARSPDTAAYLAHPEGLHRARMLSALVASYCHPDSDDVGIPAYTAPGPRLSPRQREALQWLAAGHGTGRIAERMGVSISMVERHIAMARRKLRARSREQALAIAISRHLIDV